MKWNPSHTRSPRGKREEDRFTVATTTTDLSCSVLIICIGKERTIWREKDISEISYSSISLNSSGKTRY
jgi:hypothetical protein